MKHGESTTESPQNIASINIYINCKSPNTKFLIKMADDSAICFSGTNWENLLSFLVRE